VLDQHPVGYSEFAQGVNWLGTPLGWRARVEKELTRVTLLVYGRVAVTEHDYVGVRETAPHPRCTTGRRSTVMDHPDLHSAQLDHSADGKHPRKGNVIVAQYGVDRREFAQQPKDPRIEDVTSMQDGVRPAQTLPRRLRQLRANAPAWRRGPQVSVGHDYRSDATGGRPCSHPREDRELRPPGA
jgi:hypothetical protein